MSGEEVEVVAGFSGDNHAGLYTRKRGSVVEGYAHMFGVNVGGWKLELYDEEDDIRAPRATMRGDREKLAELAATWLLGGEIGMWIP